MQQLTTIDAVQFWQLRTSRQLTNEDGRQAIANIRGFFETLERWASTSESSDSADNMEAE